MVNKNREFRKMIKNNKKAQAILGIPFVIVFGAIIILFTLILEDSSNSITYSSFEEDELFNLSYDTCSEIEFISKNNSLNSIIDDYSTLNISSSLSNILLSNLSSYSRVTSMFESEENNMETIYSLINPTYSAYQTDEQGTNSLSIEILNLNSSSFTNNETTLSFNYASSDYDDPSEIVILKIIQGSQELIHVISDGDDLILNNLNTGLEVQVEKECENYEFCLYTIEFDETTMNLRTPSGETSDFLQNPFGGEQIVKIESDPETQGGDSEEHFFRNIFISKSDTIFNRDKFQIGSSTYEYDKNFLKKFELIISEDNIIYQTGENIEQINNGLTSGSKIVFNTSQTDLSYVRCTLREEN